MKQSELENADKCREKIAVYAQKEHSERRKKIMYFHKIVNQVWEFSNSWGGELKTLFASQEAYREITNPLISRRRGIQDELGQLKPECEAIRKYYHEVIGHNVINVVFPISDDHALG